jgi:hypothetical protein
VATLKATAWLDPSVRRFQSRTLGSRDVFDQAVKVVGMEVGALEE